MPMPQLKPNSPACFGVKEIIVVLCRTEFFGCRDSGASRKRPQAAASLASIRHSTGTPCVTREAVGNVAEALDPHHRRPACRPPLSTPTVRPESVCARRRRRTGSSCSLPVRTRPYWILASPSTITAAPANLRKCRCKCAGGKARHRRERQQRRKRAERKRQHGQRADREAALGEDIELKRLGEAARQEKRRSSENKGAAIGVAFGEVMDGVAERFRHGRQKARHATATA